MWNQTQCLISVLGIHFPGIYKWMNDFGISIIGLNMDMFPFEEENWTDIVNTVWEMK